MARYWLVAPRLLLAWLPVVGVAPNALAQAGVPYLAEPPPATPPPPPPDESETPLKGKRKAREARSVEEAPEPAAGEPATAAPAYAPASFAQLWASRRTARALGQVAEARRLLNAMILNKEKSGWPNLFAYGEALARESARAADRQEAVELAAAAVALAPDRPEPHAAQGRALWKVGGHRGESLAAFARGYLLTFSEPPMLSAHVGNLALTVVAALWLAAVLFAVAVLYAHARMLVHDLLHLLPTGA
ncbi:MAG: hypothetical protein HYZ27_06200, partial [Deltaproteobacteria bacterium]|nr:hypothetical protein [Deltaproteobacteria bacterium]